MNEKKYKTIIEGKISLSDSYFEDKYKIILGDIKNNTNLILDFRFIRWFDLWPLMQILLIIKNHENKSILLRLINPDYYSESDSDSIKTRNRALSRIKFLYDCGFISNAIDLGINTVLSNPFETKGQLISSTDDLLTKVPEIIGFRIDGIRPLIPITSIEDLEDVQALRNLYTCLDKILKSELKNDLFLINSGLSDCIIQELIENIKNHAGRNGYLALRAGSALNPHNTKYSKTKRKRMKHRLPDWKQYFEKFPDESYLELIVSDFGEGISETIKMDKNLPKELHNVEDNTQLRHKLLEYSLNNHSSRFSFEERMERGLSELTGLGAINYVLKQNFGTILIREGNSRHIFNLMEVESSGFEKNSESNELNYIKGTSVTCLIPRLKNHSIPISYQKLQEILPKKKLLPIQNINFEVFKIEDILNNEKKKILSEVVIVNWDELIKTIRGISNKLLIIDIKNVSTFKNEIWRGFLNVVEAMLKNKNIVFLFGVSERIILRLKDFINVEKEKFKKKKNWFIFALSDSGHLYCIGFMNENSEKNEEILNNIAHSFFNSSELNQREFANFYLDYSNPFISMGNFTFSLNQVWTYFYFCLQEFVFEILKLSNIFLYDEVIELINGEKVKDFIFLNSIPQITEIYPYLKRLFSMIANQYEFDYIMSFGVNPFKIALDLQQEQLAENGKYIKRKSYLDYFHLDYGESNVEEITNDTTILLLLNVVRSSYNCKEVVNHINNLSAKIPIIISLFFLGDDINQSEFNGIPFFSIFSSPVREVNKVDKAKKKYNPFKGVLSENWNHAPIYPSIKDTNKLYQYVEQYNLIRVGHYEYNDRHFHTVFDFQFLVDGASFLMNEILFEIEKIVNMPGQEIDTILFPGHTTIILLVNLLIKKFEKKNINYIMANTSFWPGDSKSYELDTLSKNKIVSSERILILDDQVITGKTLENLFSLGFIYNKGKIKAIKSFVIVNSMDKSEEKVFRSMVLSDRFKNKKKIQISLISFFNISILQGYDSSKCPSCELQKKIQKMRLGSLGIVENIYSKNRIYNLRYKSLNEGFVFKYMQTLLPKPLKIKMDYKDLDIIIFSEEGLILFIEELYSEGEIIIIIDEFLSISSPHFHYLTSSIIINIIQILSRNFMLLSQVQISQIFYNSINEILALKKMNVEDIAIFFEIISEWPLYYLEKILNKMLYQIKSKDSDELIIILPSIELLFLSILSRDECNLKTTIIDKIKDDLNDYIKKMLDGHNDSNSIKTYIFVNLNNLINYERNENQSIGIVVSNFSFLLGYFVPKEKAIHAVLRRGLELIGDSKPDDKALEFVYTIEMLNQFKSYIDVLTRNYSVLERAIEHKDFFVLEYNIKELIKLFPANLDESINSIYEKFLNKAKVILDIIYRKNKPDSFKSVLSSELNSYRLPLNFILEEYFRFSEFINVKYSSNLEEIIEFVFLTLNVEYSKLIFGQIRDNLLNEQIIFSNNKNNSQRSFNFEKMNVILDGHISFDKFIIKIKSPISSKSKEKITKNISGLGIPQISKYSEQIGIEYNYQIKSENQRELLMQILTIRRFFK